MAQFVNTQEAADILGCTTFHISRLRAAGKIRSRKVDARSWLIYESSVFAYDRLCKKRGKRGRPRISQR